MTGQTKELIQDFVRDRQPIKISQIILRMQEEDAVSDTLERRNCFKAIRNIAAHEPNTLCDQILSEENVGNQRIVFLTKEEKIVVLDMVQFAVWMAEMYLKKRDKEYLEFLKGIYEMLYPNALQRFCGKGNFQFHIIGNVGTLKSYMDWSQFMYEKFGIVKPIASTDPYTITLYRENKKVFWKIALPDMMGFVCFLLSGSVELEREENLRYFLLVYEAREGER